MVIVVVEDAVGGALQQLAAPQFSDLQRLVPHVDAIVCKKIEGVQPHLCIAFALVQSLES